MQQCHFLVVIHRATWLSSWGRGGEGSSSRATCSPQDPTVPHSNPTPAVSLASMTQGNWVVFLLIN